MISRNLNVKRLSSFFFVLLAGASFPLLLATSRIAFQEDLVRIVYFQSTVVFFTFVAQLGLRAGGRIHYHVGKSKTIDYVTSYIFKNVWKLGATFSLIVVLFDFVFYPSFILLQASLSYLQGLYVAKKHNAMIILNSAAIAGSVFIAGSFILSVDSAFHIHLIEVSSVAVLFLASFRRKSLAQPSREKKVFLSLIDRYKGLQYSSYIVYLSTYILAQVFVMAGDVDQEFIEIYTDCVLVAGVQLLIIGQLSVFIEGDIIKSRAYKPYIYVYVGWCLISAFVFFLLYGRITEITFPLLTLSTYIAIISRLAFSFCSQYIDRSSRHYIYKLGLVAVAINSCVVFLIWGNETYLGEGLISFLIFISSGLTLTLVLLMYEKYRKTDFFI